MRIIISLLLVAVVLQGAFAVSSKANQAKILLEKANTTLDKSPLGRALKNMITLTSKLGYNFEDLYEALNQLKDNLLNKKQNEEDLYQEQSSQHSSTVQLLEGVIGGYKQYISEEQSDLNSTQIDLQTNKDLLQAAENSLSNAQREKQDSEEFLAVVNEAYQNEVNEYQQAGDVINQAVSQLESAQASFNKAELGEYSFVQLKNTFVSFAQKIIKGTEKMSSKHQLFIKPVVQAMNQISSSSNQASIQNVVNALRDLQDYFVRALNNATAAYVVARDGLQQRIQTLSEQITILSEVTIPALEQTVSLLEIHVQQVEENLQVAQQSLAESEQSLVDENESFERVSARHEALIQRINTEYNLVVQAEVILRTASNNQEA